MKKKHTIFSRFNHYLFRGWLKPSFLGVLIGTLIVVSITGSAAATLRVNGQTNHIFVIVLENGDYSQIIGNTALAPQLNSLANKYSFATNYHGVTHPSEPNYVTLIGGDYFGIRNDGSYTSNTINKPSLVDQLEVRQLTWKTYQQSLPYAGYTGTTYPSSSNPLYVSKHNPFLNFSKVQNSNTQLQKIVPETQLTDDLNQGKVPNFSFIVPDQCHNMHGGGQQCPLSIPGSTQNKTLIKNADTYVGKLVNTIMTSSLWLQGKNIIFITWDENDNWLDSTNKIPTIAIANQGPRGRTDSTNYNHYSLLRTVQSLFRLRCLRNSCNAQPMTSLLSN